MVKDDTREVVGKNIAALLVTWCMYYLQEQNNFSVNKT